MTVVDFALLVFTVNDSTNFNITTTWQGIEIFQAFHQLCHSTAWRGECPVKRGPELQGYTFV
jgi:hypothetical protein